MTNEQREIIIRMRMDGHGLAAIARETGLSRDSVKSFCRRNDITGVVVKKGCCPQCGKRIDQNPHSKPKRFCSAHCRQVWWNAHPEQVSRKAVYEFVCAKCGQPFSAYGNNRRKYCSHGCYIKARFEGGGSSDKGAV